MWELDHKATWESKNFEPWFWRRLLRVPWTAKRSNQSILKETNHEYSLEGLMLMLKLRYFGHLMRRSDIRKDPDAGKDWRQEEKGMTEDKMVGWHHQFNGHEFKQAHERVKDREAWHAAVHGVAKNWSRLSDWSATTTDVQIPSPSPCKRDCSRKSIL